jgi:hypothetical protein
MRMAPMSAVQGCSTASCRGISCSTSSLFIREPRVLVSVALANKMARIVWALLTKQEDYRAAAAVAA